MKWFKVNLYDHVLRDGDDGGGAGGAAAGASGSAGSAGSSDAPPAGGGASAPSAAPGAAAASSSAAAAAASFYRPADLPDNMVGKTLEETMDNVAKALKGYRDRDAAKPAAPAEASAYMQFGDTIAPDIKPYVETLANDPLSKMMADYALEKGLPVETYQGLVQRFLTAGKEMGLMEPPIDQKAERAALLPESAKHLPPAEQNAAIERRMNDNLAFIDLLTQGDKGMAKEDAEYVKAMLGDNAKGHRAIEFLRGRLQPASSGGPAMGMPGAAGGDAGKALREKLALPENTVGNPKFNRASYDAVQEEYRKFYGAQ